MICLWFEKDALDAGRFYPATFPESEVAAVHYAPGDYASGKAGDVLTVEFTVRSAFPASASTGDRTSNTARPFPSKSRPIPRRKRAATGMRSWAMAGRRASVAGARIAGDCPGRSPRACWPRQCCARPGRAHGNSLAPPQATNATARGGCCLPTKQRRGHSSCGGCRRVRSRSADRPRPPGLLLDSRPAARRARRGHRA